MKERCIFHETVYYFSSWQQETLSKFSSLKSKMVDGDGDESCMCMDKRNGSRLICYLWRERERRVAALVVDQTKEQQIMDIKGKRKVPRILSLSFFPSTFLCALCWNCSSLLLHGFV